MVGLEVAAPLERGKQHFPALPDADACILDCYLQHNMTGILLFHMDTQRHTSFFCIFHCICQNIRNNLTNPDFITVENIRYIFINIQYQLQVFLFEPWLNHQQDIIQHAIEFVSLRYDLHLARLYLGNI